MKLFLFWYVKHDIQRPKNSFQKCVSILLSHGFVLKRNNKISADLNSLNARMGCGCERERNGIIVFGHEENTKV